MVLGVETWRFSQTASRGSVTDCCVNLLTALGAGVFSPAACSGRRGVPLPGVIPRVGKARTPPFVWLHIFSRYMLGLTSLRPLSAFPLPVACTFQPRNPEKHGF